MKTLLLITSFLFLFSCTKSTVVPDVPDMQIGYSYYKVTNTTNDTVRFFVKRSGDMIVNLELRPKEVYFFNVSTLGLSYLTACVDSFYYFFVEGSRSCFTYPVLDRILEEIEILKK